MMKIKVWMKDGAAKEHGGGDYVMVAEPNEHGDLIIYRNHLNMITPQPVASYAAGEWSRHETTWDN